MGEDGNSIKVNLIKQDDGGSPIRHYLIKYRVKHSPEWKPEIRLPSGSDHIMLKSLNWNSEYEVFVIAENQQGKSKPAHYAFRTSAQPTIIPESRKELIFVTLCETVQTGQLWQKEKPVATR
ncbi:UNVERIFIED_CONTAM: Neural cell adhesion molecule 1 [Gekko kuhli]